MTSDPVAQAISAAGPKPTDEPTLAAQLAAIPALSRLSPHEIRALEKMQLETSANNASVKAIAARKKVAARKTHRRLHIMGGSLRGVCHSSQASFVNISSSSKAFHALEPSNPLHVI